MKYIERIVDHRLKTYLKHMGAVLITGPKWCGKTTTARQVARSVLKMDDVDRRKAYLAAAETKPSLLLEGETPRLIDEWQIAPVLWDAVRNYVDERPDQKGLFLLTGSTTVREDEIYHSGAGRIARLCMLPMSLFESGESNGCISLQQIFDHPDEETDGRESELTIEQLAFALCRGGWPEVCARQEDEDALIISTAYLDAICTNDATTVDNVRRHPDRVRAVLRSYARHVGTLATETHIMTDVLSQYGDISAGTLSSYLDAIRKLYVIDEIHGWSPNIRSKSAMRSGPKRLFSDPSMAVAALRLSPQGLLKDFNTFGLLFECLCIRDLKAYASAAGGKISYYRDKTGLEADAVLHLADGRYALIEFKLGGRQIEEGASHLLRIKARIEKANEESGVHMELPAALLIITAGSLSYSLPGGVRVIPIGCLRD